MFYLFSTGGLAMDFDLYDPDTYKEGIPNSLFNRLRRESPVVWHPEPHGGRGYWAVYKYADLVAISRDPSTYSSHRGATFIHDPNEDDLSAMQQMMLNVDPPQHVGFRNIVKHAFVPKTLQGLDQKIRRICREIIDEVAPRGECDFVNDIACQLP